MRAAQNLAPDHAGHRGIGGEGRASRDLVGAVGANGALADPLVVGNDVHCAASRMSAAGFPTARTILSLTVQPHRIASSQEPTSSSLRPRVFFHHAADA